jgi:hypothetical protein
MSDEPLDMDELIAAMQADEARDVLEVAEVLSIGDYARARGIRPQVIHYYLKTGKLHRETCRCHRMVIDVKEANELFDSLGEKHKLFTLEEEPEDEQVQ